MEKIKRYLLEILMILAFVGIGITLIACDIVEPKIEPSLTPKPIEIIEPSAEPAPEATPSPTPQPTEKTLVFETGTKAYFDDALFIGDSRTVGLKEYADMGNATFFCNVGMNSFKIFDEKVDVNGVGKVTLKQLLQTKKFAKVYILLGINELGSDIDIVADKVLAVEECVKEMQPDALIFMQANMHVTAKKSSSNKTFTNERINALNEKLAASADQKKVFYIDVNEHFDDNGCLRSDASGDGIHVTAKGYIEWGDWLCTKQIYTEGMPKPTPTLTPVESEQ